MVGRLDRRVSESETHTETPFLKIEGVGTSTPPVMGRLSTHTTRVQMGWICAWWIMTPPRHGVALSPRDTGFTC
jgi:hypothetical protein